MEALLLAGIAFTANKITSVIKSAKNKEWNTVITQVIVWLVAVAIIALVGHAFITTDLQAPGLNVTFGQLDAASILLYGLMVGSSGSFLFDFKKAFDNSDNAVETNLLAPAQPAPAPQ